MIKYSFRNSNIRFKLFLSLSILYAMLIFYLSSKSSFGDPKTIFGFLDMEFLRNIFYSFKNSNFNFLLFPFYIIYKQPDKLIHMFIYAGFGFLLYYTIKNSTNLIMGNHAMLFAIIIGTIYGAIDEFHQSFVPGRAASAWDIAADSIGMILAQTVIFIKDKLSKGNRNFSLSKKRIHSNDKHQDN